MIKNLVLFLWNNYAQVSHRCVKLTLIRAKRFGEKKIVRDGGRNKPSIFRRIFKR